MTDLRRKELTIGMALDYFFLLQRGLKRLLQSNLIHVLMVLS